MQVQFTDRGVYDNLFINLGHFHVMLALFKAIGKFIDSCEVKNIVVESEIIAIGLGLVVKFFKGKYSN